MSMSSDGGDSVIEPKAIAAASSSADMRLAMARSADLVTKQRQILALQKLIDHYNVDKVHD